MPCSFVTVISSAPGGHRRLALGAGVVRHDQDHPIALDRGRHGEGDTGVAGGRLDQRIARLDITAQLRAVDHRQCRAVLTEPAGLLPRA